MKTKVAYLIRTGGNGIRSNVEMKNVSNKLHSFKATRRAIRAAKRMGFNDAYAAKITVSADCVLK